MGAPQQPKVEAYKNLSGLQLLMEKLRQACLLAETVGVVGACLRAAATCYPAAKTDSSRHPLIQ